MSNHKVLTQFPHRCRWSTSAPDYIDYHDEEWGRPVYDDVHMFEHLLLETFQSGLSWLLILRRRLAFRAAFHDFDVRRIAAMTDDDVERLIKDPSIVRNRAKICAAIGNARAVLRLKETEGVGLAEYFWRWVNFVPIDKKRQTDAEVESSSELSERISKDLKRRGFRFIGPTVIYSHLQATGLVNDHVMACPAYNTAKTMARSKKQWMELGTNVDVTCDQGAASEVSTAGRKEMTGSKLVPVGNRAVGKLNMRISKGGFRPRHSNQKLRRSKRVANTPP